MILYGLKTCDTCRKALKSLPDAEFRDVRADGVPGEVLESAHARFGASLLNTRSTTWRGLSEAERTRKYKEIIEPVAENFNPSLRSPILYSTLQVYILYITEITVFSPTPLTAHVKRNLKSENCASSSGLGSFQSHIH